MTRKKLDKLLAKAEAAYKKQDKRTGARFIDAILKQDFSHSGAWSLLYKYYGEGQSFEGFQTSFTQQFYPSKLRLLKSNNAQSLVKTGQTDTHLQNGRAGVTGGRPSLFTRLFRHTADKPQNGPETTRIPLTTASLQSQATTPPASTARESAPTQSSQPPTTESQGQKFVPVPLLKSEPSQGQTATAPSKNNPLLESKPIGQSLPPPTLKPLLRRPLVPRPSEVGENQKIRVVVVDDIAQTRETVIRSLNFQDEIDVVGTATNGLEAIELVQTVQPEVVIMDVNMPDMDGIAATASIKRVLPYVQVIILTVQDDMDYMRQAMLAGARDFLAKPPMIEELVAAVQRASQYARQEKLKLPPVTHVHATTMRPRRGKIITLYSTRGGSGCTMLTTNLAAVLHSEETPVVVVDGDLQFGDVLVLFNTQNKFSVLDLAPRADELDSELIGEVLVKHPSGIKVLAPPRLEHAESITGDQFGKVLSFLSEHFQYVIVDTPHKLTDPALAALDTSDLIVLVTTQDIPSISRTRKFLDLIPLLNIDPQRILVIMNQFDKRVGISPEKIAQTFHIEFASVLPMDSPVVIPSINRGVPFMFQKDRHSQPLSQAVLGLVAAIRQRLKERAEVAESQQAVR